MHGQPDLLEVVAALHPAGPLANALHGGEQNRDQESDDRDHHEQLDEGEAAAMRGAVHRGERDGSYFRNENSSRPYFRRRRAQATAMPRPARASAPGSGTITSVPVDSVNVSVWLAGLVPCEVQTPFEPVNVSPV